MTCSTCGGPTHRTPEDHTDGQSFFLCRRFPVCMGGARTGPSDHDIYRREQPAQVPARVRPVTEQLEGMPV